MSLCNISTSHIEEARMWGNLRGVANYLRYSTGNKINKQDCKILSCSGVLLYDDVYEFTVNSAYALDSETGNCYMTSCFESINHVKFIASYPLSYTKSDDAEVSEPSKKEEASTDTNSSDLSTKDIYTELVSCLEELTSEKLTDEHIKELTKQGQEYDLKVSDLLHAIEFSHANVVEGYNYYKQLRDVLNQRRNCKDERRKIDIIKNSFDMSSINQAIKKLKIVDNQEYHPRVLTELFDK